MRAQGASAPPGGGRAAALLAALALLLGGCGGAPQATAGPLKIPIGDAPQLGPDDAWVTGVEFSDFQCPACSGAEPQVRALLQALPEDVRLLYRHFPLTPSPHPNAALAAEAAECARLQGAAPDGAFWEMHHRLFATQGGWSSASAAGAAAAFGDLALGLGLDGAAFDACLSSHATATRVAADKALGAPFLDGTPTFVVNGAEVLGAAGLRAAVDAALARARQQTAYPRAAYYDKVVLGL